VSTLFCWDRKEQVRELPPGIVSDPDRLRGAPSIAGRRIFAASVVALGLVARDVARDDYDLTDEQIDAALEWDRRGRPT
jgi:uncharacterized protein (DUF433 family)